MQRNYPDVVTAVKTKQAGQTVLNIASEELKFMVSGGIVDKTEGAELHEVTSKNHVYTYSSHVYVYYEKVLNVPKLVSLCEEGEEGVKPALCGLPCM